MTGVVRQDDSLVDVIGDAIAEAAADGSEVPEWGARTLARALANERDDPMSGALHHFAITGRADRDAMARELADIYQNTTYAEIRDWTNWLGTYLINLPDAAGISGDATPPDDGLDEDALRDMVERFKGICAEADAQGVPISTDDAKAIAGLLAHLLPPSSEMSRFVASGDTNLIVMFEECEFIWERTQGAPDIETWALALTHYLATNAHVANQADHPALEASALPHSLLIRYGVAKHGQAFRAYLRLPDIDPARADLIKSYLDCYVGAYDSMDDLTTDLVGGIHSEAELLELAQDDISFEELVRAGWDIVELDGTFYVFTK